MEDSALNEWLKKTPRKETFLWKKEDDGSIIIFGEMEQRLNHTAAEIWEMIDESNTVGDIVDKVIERYKDEKVTDEELQCHVFEFLDALLKIRLISFETATFSEED